MTDPCISFLLFLNNKEMYSLKKEYTVQREDKLRARAGSTWRPLSLQDRFSVFLSPVSRKSFRAVVRVTVSVLGTTAMQDDTRGRESLSGTRKMCLEMLLAVFPSHLTGQVWAGAHFLPVVGMGDRISVMGRGQSFIFFVLFPLRHCVELGQSLREEGGCGSTMPGLVSRSS